MQPDAVDQLVAMIRARAAGSGLSKLRLAASAKLHTNTLRSMGTDGWNPSLTTLRKLSVFLATCSAPGASKQINRKQSSPTRECSST